MHMVHYTLVLFYISILVSLPVFHCKPLRHGEFGKLVKVTFANLRKNKLVALRNTASCDHLRCSSNIYVKVSQLWDPR